MRVAIFLLLFSILRLSAQTVRVSGERSVALPAGEVVFTIRVFAPVDQSLARIVEALNPAGVTAEDLVYRDVPDLPVAQQFAFRIVRPAARYVELQAAIQTLALSRPDLSLSATAYTRAGTAEIEKARAEVLLDLFRRLEAQAALLLTEAGYRPGPIPRLEETIEPRTNGQSVRIALSLTMARLGASLDALGRSVATVISPPAAPYRIGAPRLTASFRVRSKTRAELLKQVAPTGLTEAHLIGVEVEADTFSQDRGRAPGPATYVYQFNAPVEEEDLPSRLATLAALASETGANVQVSYSVEPARVNQAALAGAARSRAAILARLMGGQLGASLGVAEVEAPGRTINFIAGDFPGSVLPSTRIVLVRPFLEPPLSTPLRYQFAVAPVPEP